VYEEEADIFYEIYPPRSIPTTYQQATYASIMTDWENTGACTNAVQAS
jgi:hypothetical protein